MNTKAVLLNQNSGQKRRRKKKAFSVSKDFDRFKRAIKKAKKILLSTHMLPDGDGLGAEVALFHYLKQAKKKCQIYNPDPLPERYQFLDPQQTILISPNEIHLEGTKAWGDYDLWVILDTNDPRRLGTLWNGFSSRARQIIFLDHHSDVLGNLKIADHATVISNPEASSIGELLYQIFTKLDLSQLNSKIALGLYVSVMTDTNSFRYSRTTPLAHEIAAAMINLGVNPEETYQAIYSSKKVSHLQLLGEMLQKIKTSSHGRIAWIEATLSSRKNHQASADDTLSFLSILLLLKDAEIVCLFREEDNGQIRVSIKSKGRMIVNQLAVELGGGGHDYAAGLAIFTTLDKTVKLVIGRLEKLFD